MAPALSFPNSLFARSNTESRSTAFLAMKRFSQYSRVLRIRDTNSLCGTVSDESGFKYALS